MTYNELKQKAKELGMNQVTGKTKQELESFIDSNEPSQEKSQPVKESPQHDVAIVMDDNREVRRYTLEVHGQGFMSLAETFCAQYKNYVIVTKQSEPPIQCPACGHRFDI